jgi:PKD repeat protein
MLQATGTTGTIVTGADQFAVGGDTTVRISVARLSGGNATVVAGPDSALPRAVQFPPYVGSGTYPRAVVALTPLTGSALSPGSADFEYGAVFRLNATSSGRSIDNGNNLLQRGLYGDPSQFKLQIDHGYPSCLVRGSAGQASIASSTRITPDRWYRVTCSRVGSRVTVEVAPHGSAATPVSNVRTGSTGTLGFGSSLPASIGGKLTPAGAVVSSTDQFNGAVASAWVARVPTSPPANQAPTADAGVPSCSGLSCTFSGVGSTDPENDALTYDWDFGDGEPHGSGTTTSHTYATAATRTVTLLVSDGHGNTDSDTVTVTTVDPAAGPITFVAAAATNGNRLNHVVTIPATVQAGDAMVLFFTGNTTTPTYTGPTGWTTVQSNDGAGIVVRAYSRMATAGDIGSPVTVRSSGYAKSDISVVAYRGTHAVDPVAASASKIDNVPGASHVSPAVTASGSSSWLLTYWGDESGTTTGWTTPVDQGVRASTFGSSAGHISAVVTDSNGPVAAGETGQLTAVANSTSAFGVSVSVLLASP